MAANRSIERASAFGIQSEKSSLIRGHSDGRTQHLLILRCTVVWTRITIPYQLAPLGMHNTNYCICTATLYEIPSPNQITAKPTHSPLCSQSHSISPLLSSFADSLSLSLSVLLAAAFSSILPWLPTRIGDWRDSPFPGLHFFHFFFHPIFILLFPVSFNLHPNLQPTSTP